LSGNSGYRNGYKKDDINSVGDNTVDGSSRGSGDEIKFEAADEDSIHVAK